MCGAGIWGERNSAIGLCFGLVIFPLCLNDTFRLTTASALFRNQDLCTTVGRLPTQLGRQTTHRVIQQPDLRHNWVPTPLRPCRPFGSALTIPKSRSPLARNSRYMRNAKTPSKTACFERGEEKAAGKPRRSRRRIPSLCLRGILEHDPVSVSAATGRRTIKIARRVHGQASVRGSSVGAASFEGIKGIVRVAAHRFRELENNPVSVSAATGRRAVEIAGRVWGQTGPGISPVGAAA